MLRESSQLAGRIAEIYPFGGYAKNPVIGVRQKHKGMSWSPTGSKALGILKVVELNQQWEQLWFPQQAAA